MAATAPGRVLSPPNPLEAFLERTNAMVARAREAAVQADFDERLASGELVWEGIPGQSALIPRQAAPPNPYGLVYDPLGGPDDQYVSPEEFELRERLRQESAADVSLEAIRGAGGIVSAPPLLSNPAATIGRAALRGPAALMQAGLGLARQAAPAPLQGGLDVAARVLAAAPEEHRARIAEERARVEAQLPRGGIGETITGAAGDVAGFLSKAASVSPGLMTPLGRRAPSAIEILEPLDIPRQKVGVPIARQIVNLSDMLGDVVPPALIPALALISAVGPPLAIIRSLEAALDAAGVSENTRTEVLSWLTDPLNLVPWVGFTKAADIAQAARVATRAVKAVPAATIRGAERYGARALESGPAIARVGEALPETATMRTVAERQAVIAGGAGRAGKGLADDEVRRLALAGESLESASHSALSRVKQAANETFAPEDRAIMDAVSKEQVRRIRGQLTLAEADQSPQAVIRRQIGELRASRRSGLGTFKVKSELQRIDAEIAQLEKRLVETTQAAPPPARVPPEPPRGPTAGGTAGAVAEPPPPPAGTATAVAEQPTLAKLTTLVDQARPLPEQTEVLRKTERARRVAASSRILEEGAFTGEAFQKAKGPLAGEMPRAAFDAPSASFAPEEIQQLRSMIGQSDLRTFERINTNEALGRVLEGRLNEIRPFEIDLLDRVYGTKFALAVAKQAAPPSLADKAFEWWLSSILSGPLTQARNIVGNTAAAMFAPIERLGAAALEVPVSRIQGRPAARFFEEVLPQVFGMVNGLPKGVTGALRVMKGGLGEAALVESVSRVPAISGLKGRIIRIPLTGLEAMDAFFGAINFEGAYSALAVRAARQEGLKGSALQARIADLMAERTDDLIEAATKEKLMRLFRDEPTRIGQAVMNARQTYPPIRFLVPFARTPDRLLAYGVRRSPLGLFDFPMWQRLVKGNPAAVDELAQTLMGSAVAFAFGGLIASGQLDITGAVPTSAAARDRFFREGKLPFSVKLPGVGWVQYNQIPGLDMTLSLVAAATEAFKDGASIDGFVAQTAATIGQSIFSKSYVAGLADFMDIFNGGFSDPVDSAQRWVSRQASGVIPYSAALRQTSSFLDRTVYQPEGFAEQLATGTGIAGFAGVPPKLTAFGEASQRAVPSPVQVSPEQQTAIDAELGRLGIEVGFVGDSIAGIKLSREEQADYQRRAGQATATALARLIEFDEYRTASEIDKQKAIESTISKVRDRVRDQILQEAKDKAGIR